MNDSTWMSRRCARLEQLHRAHDHQQRAAGLEAVEGPEGEQHASTPRRPAAGAASPAAAASRSAAQRGARARRSRRRRRSRAAAAARRARGPGRAPRASSPAAAPWDQTSAGPSPPRYSASAARQRCRCAGPMAGGISTPGMRKPYAPPPAWASSTQRHSTAGVPPRACRQAVPVQPGAAARAAGELLDRQLVAARGGLPGDAPRRVARPKGRRPAKSSSPRCSSQRPSASSGPPAGGLRRMLGRRRDRRCPRRTGAARPRRGTGRKGTPCARRSGRRRAPAPPVGRSTCSSPPARARGPGVGARRARWLQVEARLPAGVLQREFEPGGLPGEGRLQAEAARDDAAQVLVAPVHGHEAEPASRKVRAKPMLLL
jgi:hypothetical protein